MHPKTVLIVEDDTETREALENLIRGALGYRVLEAHTGKEGVEVALRHHPDLILLDFLMPEMDGLTALNRLRDDPWGQSARVIILTSLDPGRQRMIDSVLKHKPLYYLLKSEAELPHVVEKVKEVLESPTA